MLKIKLPIVLIAGVVAAVAATAVVAGTGRDSDPPRARLHAPSRHPVSPRAPRRFNQTRRFGLVPRRAETIFQAETGVFVAVVRRGAVGCLLYSTGVDMCSSTAEIAIGHSLRVDNDCADRGSHAMTVTGMVPSDVAAVAFRYSDGTVHKARLDRSVFLLDAVTPRRGEPYPTAMLWHTGHRKHRQFPFPIQPYRYCDPPSVGS
jgi:hypothetical protein